MGIRIARAMKRKPPAREPMYQPENTDQPDMHFLECLFAAMCQNLFVLPGESFVEQARRWTDALDFTAALKPRDEAEWRQAADVTMKQFSAIHSLVMRKRRGITPKQRSRYEQDFLCRATAMQDARLRYDLLRSARPD